MKSDRPEYSPINGKTYSLFGESDSTAEFYETIRQLADEILALNGDTKVLVENIKEFSSKKRILKKSLRIKDPGNMMSVILNLIDPYLKRYTEDTEEHLRTLPVSSFWDRRLATTREQYHLYMLEIELTWGMRNCRKHGIPVVGIALNANRCVRWFGEFFPNSIDLSELERLVSGCK